jgi:transposase
VRRELHRISGVDLTRIDGIDVGVAQTLISEVGVDMMRWNTEAHFASWLGLCPDNRISGDRVLRKGTRHVVNRAATALRIAATTLLRSQSYSGPNTVASAANSARPKPSRPWRTSSPAGAEYDISQLVALKAVLSGAACVTVSRARIS